MTTSRTYSGPCSKFGENRENFEVTRTDIPHYIRCIMSTTCSRAHILTNNDFYGQTPTDAGQASCFQVVCPYVRASVSPKRMETF